MSDPAPVEVLDPIRFTLALCRIESTTYNEGAVGDYLADFLAGRGWAVEKTPVPQPAESAMPTPIRRNRTMIFTPTPTASAMYFST